MEIAPLNHTNSVATWPLVASENFILATRDAGYRSTAAAIAELIDNSLQARASHIRIFVFARSEPVGCPLNVAVSDDGEGMDPSTLRRSLQFGGSGRFN